MPTLSILIPVYNEAAYIRRCLENIINEDIGNWKKQLILVNDGSTDNTLQVCKDFQKQYPQLTIINNPINQGKGNAVKVAAEHATGEVLIIQDGDLEYDPNDYNSILREYENVKIDVVYGSRILGAKKYTNYSSNAFFYFGGVALTNWINMLFKTTLTDQATCYKSWRSSLTKDLLHACQSKGFEFEVEMTAFFAKNYTIKEVPIHYYPRAVNHGKKINLFDFFTSMFCAFKYRLSHY